MKTRLLTAAFVLMGALFVLPSSTSAFEVTDTSAVRLTPNHTLLTVTYQFGFLNRELYMPIFAHRTSERRGTSVGYTITNRDGDVITSGSAAAIVLGDAEIRNREYYVPKGRNGNFTLTALVYTPSITEDFKLTVTRLPFRLIDGDISVSAAVTAEQLAGYQTDLIR